MAGASVVVDVLAPVAVDTAYSYKADPALNLAPGDFVVAPLGAATTTGVVWALREGGGDNLKSVIARRDGPGLPGALREFCDWVARWTLAPRGMVLRLATRGPAGAAAEPERFALRLTGKLPARQTEARTRVLAALAATPLVSKPRLAEAAQCSSTVIDGLLAEGVLALETLPPEEAPRLDPGFNPPTLEPDQQAAADALVAAVEAHAFGVTLLEGVTGSGKTEVYLEAIATCLSTGRPALALVPEIALTADFLRQFEARFGAAPLSWHSGLTARQRERTWRWVAEGKAQVVVGARSAIFLPFADLGLIVVDEEHEGAYKQDEGVTYNARDMAVVRARIAQAPIVLASATPSVESRHNAEQGRYRWLRLNERYGPGQLPKLAAIDLRVDAPPRGRWLSPKLVVEIAATRERGEQSLMFLNRRGYAPLTLCRTCGHRFQCPNCSAWLVDHRFRKTLVCHHCGHAEPRPDACPVCDEGESLVACGPGVERLGEEIEALFPGAKTLILSSDLAGGPEAMRAQLAAAARGDFEILIGTQLVAKGHNFPLLTLVGIVDADIGLANGDPRASERTFQMLRQATGRAGRYDKPGLGLLQTYQPDHPVIAAILSGDVDRFYAVEIEQRRRGFLPPFSRLAAILVSAPDKGAAERHARALAGAAYALAREGRFRIAAVGAPVGEDEIQLLGPAEAPLAFIRGRHRFRLLARAARGIDLQTFLRALLEAAPPPRGGVRVAVDIDPLSFA